jgi:hypothetical protein
MDGQFAVYPGKVNRYIGSGFLSHSPRVGADLKAPSAVTKKSHFESSAAA